MPAVVQASQIESGAFCIHLIFLRRLRVQTRLVVGENAGLHHLPIVAGSDQTGPLLLGSVHVRGFKDKPNVLWHGEGVSYVDLV